MSGDPLRYLDVAARTHVFGDAHRSEAVSVCPGDRPDSCLLIAFFGKNAMGVRPTCLGQEKNKQTFVSGTNSRYKHPVV
jgi:hypothetical protein